MNWKNPFYQSTEIICAVLGMNRNALVKRRKKLHHLGLIKYRKGVANSRPAEYRIINIFEKAHDKNIKTKKDTLPKVKENEAKLKAKEKTAFRKPRMKDIAEYCSVRKNGIDAALFDDFYQSKNWMVGSNKMKDWKAAVRTWEMNGKGAKTNAMIHDNGEAYEKF